MNKTCELSELDRQKRSRDRQQFAVKWIIRFLICYVVCMSAYVIWLFAGRGLTITYTGNVQRNYAKYLVEQNDEFVGYMMEFTALTQKTGEEYSDAEKAVIKELIEKQNNLLKKLQVNTPNDANQDYYDLYQDMLQIYAFYIQGEVMIAEYCYMYTDNYTLENNFSDSAASLESYTMGHELCNMMGNMILNNYKYINEIRGTNYPSKFNIVEIGTGSSSGTITETPTEESDEDEDESSEEPQS